MNLLVKDYQNEMVEWVCRPQSLDYMSPEDWIIVASLLYLASYIVSEGWNVIYHIIMSDSIYGVEWFEDAEIAEIVIGSLVALVIYHIGAIR